MLTVQNSFSIKTLTWRAKPVYGLVLASIILTACSRHNNKLFTELSSSKTGISFNNRLVEDAELNVLNYTYFYNGGGVATGDINNDGLADIVFTGNMVKNRLYLNKGNFEFEDVTETSGIASEEGWCTGVTMADVNADGWLDIYICRSADVEPSRRQNLLFINNKNNTFTESAAKYGIADRGNSTQGSFFDYDRDGDLDLIVINHSLQKYTTGTQENPALRTQRDPAFATRLYRNEGTTYIDVSDSAGIISNVLSFGLGVAVSDLNNDNWPDIYVSNDFNEQDYCFINNQNGTFSEVSKSMFRQMSLYSMGSDAADLNNDGLMDIVTLDMMPESNYLQKMHSGAENFDKFQVLFWNGFHYQYSRNMLQINNGNGTFSEVGQYAGISNTDWSWAALATDFDNDGLKDIYITNGYVKDYTDMDFLKYSADKAQQASGNTDKQAVITDVLNKMPTIKLPNYLFQNKGNLRFENKAQQWGLEKSLVSAGASYADLDNDGDLDLVVNNSNEKASVYRNNVRENAKSNYISIQLKGKGKNLDALGASVTVEQGGRIQKAEVITTRGFQSGVALPVHFGFGQNNQPISLSIVWPDGTSTKKNGVALNQRLVIDQVKESGALVTDSVSESSLLQSSPLPFAHVENAFNDFTRQPLLPEWFSRQGPALAVADVNGDKLDDVYLGGASGKSGALLIQQASGEFLPKKLSAFAADSLCEDVTAIFFDMDADGDKDLLVGSGGYENEEASGLLQNRLYINDGKGFFTKATDALPQDNINDKAIAAADFDGDGDTDLFMGGHCVPGRFPEPSGAQLLINNGKGKFSNALKTWFGANNLNNLITAAAAADFNGDGRMDLALAGHWMGIELWLNKGNQFENQTQTWNSSPGAGLYNTLLVADLNGDNKPDIVAGNQGLNNQFGATKEEPVQLFYSDFDGNGIKEPVMSYFIGGKPWPAHSRDDLVQQIPSLNKKYLFYADYAKAGLSDIFEPSVLAKASSYELTNLQTVLFENKGNGFISHQLPYQVQWAPVHSIVTTDVNSDGKPDLIGGGNQSFTRIRYGRFDASYGWLLLNDGKFGFSWVSPARSGLKIAGDIRNMARVNDRVVTAINNQQAAIIKLNSNKTSK